MLDHFFLLDDKNVNKRKFLITSRKRRGFISNWVDLFKFSTGDIIVIVFWKEYIVYRFEGLCISIKKKSLMKQNVSLVLRNVILGVGIEVTVLYFVNRVYNLSLSDYKRKEFSYKRSKLYYVRSRINRSSRIK